MMHVEEAYRVLGISDDATPDEVKAAFRSRAKETHPDTGSLGNEGEFRRVCEARDALLEFLSPAETECRAEANPRGDSYADGSESTSTDQARERPEDKTQDAASRAPAAPVDQVKHFLRSRNYTTTYYQFEEANRRKSATERAHIKEVLERRDLTLQTIEREIALDPEMRATGLSKSDARAALITIQEDFRHSQRVQIWTRLNLILGKEGTRRERENLVELASNSFLGDPEVNAAVIEQGMWQVLRKKLDLQIEHHMMPLIWSGPEGPGKTTFLNWLLTPLKELCSPIASIEEFLDPRFSSLMQYAVIFLDDVSSLPRHRVADFNRIVTARTTARRVLGSSEGRTISNHSTLFATANHTFNPRLRRVAPIEFGDPSKNPSVLAYGNKYEAERFWRSIDPHRPAPILPFLAELRKQQGRANGDDIFLMWCGNFDPADPDAEAVNARRGYMAAQFGELYCRQTGQVVSMNEFSTLMGCYEDDDRSPFGPKVHSNAGAFYPLKASRG